MNKKHHNQHFVTAGQTHKAQDETASFSNFVRNANQLLSVEKKKTIHTLN